MPKKEIINPDAAKPNPNLSPATRFGNLVFVSGQTGRHPVSGELGKDVRDAAYNEEYAKYFPTNKPARTTVTVAALNSPELVIEITVTACIPN